MPQPSLVFRGGGGSTYKIFLNKYPKMSANLLALDSSTDYCSAALLMGDEIISREVHAPRHHTRWLLPMMEELLAEAQLTLSQIDALAFGHGPGGFTGLRVAAGVAQGVAFSQDLPVIPVSSLAAMAQAAILEEGALQILPALDARMQEVYWGEYQKDAEGYAMAVSPECVAKPEEVSITASTSQAIYWGVGSGWQTYRTLLKAKFSLPDSQIKENYYPQARYIAHLGYKQYKLKKFVLPHQATPLYLRSYPAPSP